MYKYRRLTIEELELLEDSFIRFLAAQSIPAGDWKQIQKTDPDRQMTLIDQFSDVVIEKTLHNVKVLEHRLPKRILFFTFSEEQARIIGIEFKEEPPFPLNAGFSLKELSQLLENKDIKYDLIRGEKPYSQGKNREIFNIIQQGAQIPANEELFNFVYKLIGNNL